MGVYVGELNALVVSWGRVIVHILGPHNASFEIQKYKKKKNVLLINNTIHRKV